MAVAKQPADIGRLYERHAESLLLFLARRTADPQIALDLWAEVFAQVTAGAGRFRGSTEEEAAGWLYAIARRQLALYYRRGHAERRALDRLKLERPPADAGVLAEIERRAGLGALRADLAAALAQLTPAVRGAVQMRVVDELSYPDVARRLAISEQAARARVSRGLAALAELLDAPDTQGGFDMTEPHDLDRYLDAFGRRLDDAAHAGSAAPARRRRLVLIGAAAVAAAGIAVSLLGSSAKHLDPVAEAQAALDPPGEIVHMRITSTFVAARASSVPPPQTTEQWTALDPPRWRFVQTLPPTRQGHGGTLDARGPITGRQEFSYADGVQRTYNADRDALSVTRGYSNDGPAARVPSPLGAGSGDLQTDLRSMLAGANVTDEGERQINGRTVRRLVSEQRSQLGSASTTRSEPAGRSGLVRTLVYDVDPQTFAPIEGTLTITIPSRPHALRLTSRMHVDAYERIPLTATTARLLRIQTTPRTTVIVHSERSESAGRSHYGSDDGSGASFSPSR